jgi:hypothetical protein
VGVVLAAGVYGVFYRHVQSARRCELRTLGFALLIFSLLHGLTDTVPFGLSYPLWLMAVISVCLTVASTEAHTL